jgi:hypothetical protein
MIHFDFIVHDSEAETIFECLQDEINSCNGIISEYVYILSNSVKGMELEREGIEKLEAEIKWYKNRISYIKELKKKMKNTNEVK